eukprot:3678657-Rhodomonas_salina.1
MSNAAMNSAARQPPPLHLPTTTMAVWPTTMAARLTTMAAEFLRGSTLWGQRVTCPPYPPAPTQKRLAKVLRTRYAMSGTDVGYAATSSLGNVPGLVSRQVPALLSATHTGCDLRY